MVTQREYQGRRRSRGAKRHTNLPKSTFLWTILILGILGLVSHYSDSNTLNLSLSIINPDLRIIPANLAPGVQKCS